MSGTRVQAALSVPEGEWLMIRFPPQIHVERKRRTDPEQWGTHCRNLSRRIRRPRFTMRRPVEPSTLPARERAPLDTTGANLEADHRPEKLIGVDGSREGPLQHHRPQDQPRAELLEVVIVTSLE